jgi:DNA-binding transcriptional MerR regulator
MAYREYHHQDILRFFPDIKARSLIHWAEIGIIIPLHEPENKGGKRVYNYANLIEIAVIRELSGHGIDLREIKRVVFAPELQGAIKTGGGDDLLYYIQTGPDGETRERFEYVKEFDPDLFGWASTVLVNIGYLKKFVDKALGEYVE